MLLGPKTRILGAAEVGQPAILRQGTPVQARGRVDMRFGEEPAGYREAPEGQLACLANLVRMGPMASEPMDLGPGAKEAPAQKWYPTKPRVDRKGHWIILLLGIPLGGAPLTLLMTQAPP